MRRIEWKEKKGSIEGSWKKEKSIGAMRRDEDKSKMEKKRGGGREVGGTRGEVEG